MIPLMILLTGITASAGVDFQIGERETVRLRVEVVADSDSPERKWAAFLDKLFDHFDRDGNGVLSAAEAQRIFPLPLPDGRQVKLDFKKLNASGDGRATKEEFRSFYRAAGFSPLVAVIRTPDTEAMRLSDALFRHLDRDRDGVISAAEWKQAPTLFRRLDENENEVLEPNEILGAKTIDEKLSPAPASLKIADLPGKPSACVYVELGGTPQLRLAKESPVARLSETERLLKLPSDQIRFALPGKEAVSGFRTAKEFYLAQFNEALGDKSALTREDLESDASLQSILSMFDAADRDGDGKLSARELAGFLDLVELGVGCQVCLALEGRGRSLFDLLDTNSDGVLDYGELHRATGRPEVKRDQVASSWRLAVLLECPAKAFGPVPLPSSKGSIAKPARATPAGPAWFRAMDRNGDGFVSVAEFRGPPELFKKLDQDGDGRISPREAEQGGK